IVGLRIGPPAGKTERSARAAQRSGDCQSAFVDLLVRGPVDRLDLDLLSQRIECARAAERADRLDRTDPGSLGIVSLRRIQRQHGAEFCTALAPDSRSIA